MPELAIGTPACRFLLAAAEAGFQGALDLQFGLLGHPVLVGAVFPISVILLALGDHRRGDADVEALLAREATTLAALGDAHGWRYFHLCPEIPPDADDLAQVIALLRRARTPEALSRLEGPLRVLERNRLGPGQFRTWLAIDEEPGALDAAWGSAGEPVHPEVVANLACALWELDSDRWGKDVQATLEALAIRHPDGVVPSFWYYGLGYGAYQASRLAAAARADHPWRTAVARALLARQRDDGGWAMQTPARADTRQGGGFRPSPGASVLETAFCLAALRHAPPLEGLDEARRRALALLAQQQDSDGGFAAEPCYLTLGAAAHGSRALTTAAVLLGLGPPS